MNEFAGFFTRVINHYECLHSKNNEKNAIMFLSLLSNASYTKGLLFGIRTVTPSLLFIVVNSSTVGQPNPIRQVIRVS